MASMFCSVRLWRSSVYLPGGTWQMSPVLHWLRPKAGYSFEWTFLHSFIQLTQLQSLFYVLGSVPGTGDPSGACWVWF